MAIRTESPVTLTSTRLPERQNNKWKGGKDEKKERSSDLEYEM